MLTFTDWYKMVCNSQRAILFWTDTVTECTKYCESVRL